ncbi:MAG: hypothetical protein E7611_06185 [Ruminococcaceae bacterium]|nr:hypothetical protein [Oscillospiraceae bacterium]
MSKTINENIVIKENGTTLKDTVINGKIYVEADRVSIINCTINTDSNAIISSGKYFVARGNKINCPINSITLEKGSYNCLVAQNETDGEISVSLCYNCSVTLNKAARITARNNKNVYVIENTVSEVLTLSDNNYIIADENTFDKLVAYSNSNENGDTVTNIDERLTVGANERLLPHTNKDLFIGMEVLPSVPDASLDSPLTLPEYLTTLAKTEDIVIVAPGAYVCERVYLDATHSNTKIYAYGTYAECPGYQSAFFMTESENISLLGLTVGYAVQSAHQMHVLEKKDGEIITVVAPGHKDVTEDKKYGHTVIDGNSSYATMTTLDAKKNEDGTYTMGYTDSPTKHVKKGDVLSRRVSTPTEGSFDLKCSSGILFKDVVLYGQSSGLAFVENSDRKHTTMIRVHNTNRAPYIITKEEYNYYKSLEMKYNTSLEVYIDEEGRCRGSVPRIGSVDATHIIGCDEGVHATSCLFEHMCDDGSNHHAASSRLASATDNGDGTVTLALKPNVTEVYYCQYNKKTGSRCHPFRRGDVAYIYNSKGQLFCSTPVLDDQKTVGKAISSFTDLEYDLIEIKVAASEVNFSALDGFDLSEDHYRIDNKVLVDNMSRTSQGFVFDNIKVDGIRSRAFMVKAPNGVIKNCTFTNLNESGVGIKTEIQWGESTIAHNTTLENNIFSNVSSLYGHNFYYPIAPLSVQGFSKIVGDGYLPYENITIKGNRFENCDHKYCITLNSAKNVKILNNTFCPINHEYEDEVHTPITICIDTAMDVEISGNKFTENAPSVLSLIHAKNYKNVYGTDISDENGNTLLPDNIN